MFPIEDGDDAACVEEKGGKVFISRQSLHFPFVDNILLVILPALHLDLACKKMFSQQWKRYG